MQTNQCHGQKQALRRLGLASGLLTALATMANAANPPSITPGIPGEGAMHPLPDAAYQPQKEVTYHIVFAITKGGETPQEASPSLVRVARTVNLYVSAGVPISHLKFVAVASGAATGAMLDEQHYKAKFGVANPNAHGHATIKTAIALARA